MWTIWYLLVLSYRDRQKLYRLFRLVFLGMLEEVASGTSSIAYDANSDVAPYETLMEADGNARSWAAAWCGVVSSDQPNEFLNRRISAFDVLSEVFGRMSATKK